MTSQNDRDTFNEEMIYRPYCVEDRMVHPGEHSDPTTLLLAFVSGMLIFVSLPLIIISSLWLVSQ